MFSELRAEMASQSPVVRRINNAKITGKIFTKLVANRWIGGKCAHNFFAIMDVQPSCCNAFAVLLFPFNRPQADCSSQITHSGQWRGNFFFK